MNKARIGVITICVTAAASGYLLSRGTATDETPPVRASRVQTADFAASHRVESASADHAPTAPGIDSQTTPAMPATAPELEPGTLEMLPPSRRFDELLDAMNAAIGPEGEQIDREALAAMLRSDPDLARILNP